MANPYKGAVDIRIGGENRQMKFDMNALCNLEDVLKKPVSEIFDSGNLGLSAVRAGIYCGLLTYNKRVTLEQVGTWMSDDMDQFDTYVAALGEALTHAVGGISPPAGPEGNAEAGATISATPADPEDSTGENFKSLPDEQESPPEISGS